MLPFFEIVYIPPSLPYDTTHLVWQRSMIVEYEGASLHVVVAGTVKGHQVRIIVAVTSVNAVVHVNHRNLQIPHHIKYAYSYY